MKKSSPGPRARRLALNDAARMAEELQSAVGDATYRLTGADSPWRCGAIWMADRIAKQLREAAKHGRRGP